VIELVTVCVGV